MEKISFDKLSEKKKSRLIQFRAEGSTLKGSKDGIKEAKLFFARKKPKTARQWHNQIYFAMIRIDKARKKIGLSPVHFK